VQHASEFVLMFAAAVYEAELAELDRHVNYPVSLMIPNMDITIADRVDLAEAVGILRSGVETAGVARMDRWIVSAVQTETTFAVVIVQTQRLGAQDEDLGGHQSTFVLDGIEDEWKVRSLTVTNAPDNTTELAPVQRGFMRHYRHAQNARWTRRGPPETD
jgi:hypothetical protein